MATTTRTIEQVLTLLAATPRRIGEVTAVWRRPGYARARARTSGPRTRCWPTCARVPTSVAGAILTILAEDTPTIRAVDPRRWMREETDYPDLDFRRSLRAFAKNEPPAGGAGSVAP